MNQTNIYGETRKEFATPPITKQVVEEEEKARYEWNFSLFCHISSNTSPFTTSSSSSSVSDAIGVTEIDPTDKILATGGLARKIRIYDLSSLLDGRNDPNQQQTAETTAATTYYDHASACEYYICTPAKLSSLKWRPDSESRILGSGDYDGVVTEYDLERRVQVFERDEHGGRRVWSIDYACNVLGASGSDDGTAHIWDTRTEGTISVLKPSTVKSPVTAVDFDRISGNPYIALGSADWSVYIYDFRRTDMPVSTLSGHKRAVSHVRFVGDGRLVSGGVDGCLKLWDMTVPDRLERRSYVGHTNMKNFVGLSFWREGGLIGCGSESNEVFVYDQRWKDPIWVHSFDPVGQGACPTRSGEFVSCVSWRQMGYGSGECILVAGGSNGVLQILKGTRIQI